MKGGSGKSTLASCLAVHWHLTGRLPTIIDADPQRSIARLALRERALGGVPVLEDATNDAWKTAQNLAASGRPIIIDTPGFRSQATLACIAAADFLLVPVKASPLDVDRMLDTLNSLIDGAGGKRPNFRCILTQTIRDSVIAKQIRAELIEAGFRCSKTRWSTASPTRKRAYGERPRASSVERTGGAEIAAIASEMDGIVGIKQAA
jgi:chromosome partitioning protein